MRQNLTMKVHILFSRSTFLRWQTFAHRGSDQCASFPWQAVGWISCYKWKANSLLEELWMSSVSWKTHVGRSHVTRKAEWLFNVTFASPRAHWVPTAENSYLYTDSLVPGQGGSDLPLNWKSGARGRYCCFGSSTFISGIRFPGICCSWVPITKWRRNVTPIGCSQQACKSLSPLSASKHIKE